jgi:hypothetical protein
LIKSRAVEYFGAFVTYGLGENFSNGFGGETLKERNCLQDLSIDRRIVLKFIPRKQTGGVRTGFIRERKNQWKVAVSTAMNPPLL